MEMSSAKKIGNAKKAKSKNLAYKCDLCSKRFSNKWALVSHGYLHTDETPFQCTLCDYAGKTKKYLSRHIRSKHIQDRKVGCDVCGKSFQFESQMKHHMLVHTGEKPYKCAICEKAFNTSYSLRTHKLIHTNSKPFKCTFCPYACRDSSTLRKHKETHTGKVKYYTCGVCNVSCSSRGTLKIHIAEKHFNIDMKRMECDACGKRYKLRKALVLHIQTVHDKSRSAKCDICGITLSNRGNMRSHLRTHVDLRPYKCTYKGCGMRFKDASGRSKHEVKHYPERQFPCKICDKLFTREYRMHRHLKTHMVKVKNVECDYCGVRFYNKNYLTTHIQRKHGRKKQRYICDLCGLVTTNKPGIVMHIKYGHDADRLQEIICDVCQKTFKSEFNLKLHYWRAHQMEYMIPRRFKKKSKRKNESRVQVKEEPIDNNHETESYFEVTPKLEPLDEEQKYEVSNTVSEPEVPIELEDIPNEMLEEFITPTRKGPEERRLQSTKHVSVDKKSEKRVRKKIDVLMKERKKRAKERAEEMRKKCEERARQRASKSLERTRRKYNRLIQNAIRNSAKKEKIKIKHGATSAQEPLQDSLLEANFFIKKTIDNRDRVLDEPVIINMGERKDINEIGRIDNNSLLDEEDTIVNGIDSEEERIDDIEVNEINQNENKIDNIEENELDSKENEQDKIEENETDQKENERDNIEENGIDQKENEQYNIEENGVDNIKEQSGNDIDKNGTSTGNEEINKDTRRKSGRNKKLNFKYVDENYSSTEDKQERKDMGNGSDQNRKVKFNTYQCYVCFKLYQTKEELLDHCKDHFDQCEMQTYKKCPLCEYSTNLSITRHLKLKHKIKVKVLYGSFKDKHNDGTKYYYEVNDARIKELEIIPSINKLNKRESCKIDKRNREKKNKEVLKSKLVKKGKEWIVMKEKMKINFKDCLLPKFDKLEAVNVKGSYADRLKELYKLAKKSGKKMVFPCDSCDKICQTLAALKLHSRKHEHNPKPFKKKVWKHKLDGKNVEKVKVKRAVTNLDNRTAKPKPVVNKHKCDKELIEFYEQNIKGGDVEFWQFLKIYNKMERENINDFEDLQKSSHFGLHCNEPVENSNDSNEPKNSTKTDIRKNINNVKNKTVKKTVKNAFTRVVRLSKREAMRRDEARRRLRQKINCNS